MNGATLLRGRVEPTIPFIMLYPTGHDRAGKEITRESACSRCESPFTQYRVNPAWLNSFKTHSPRALEEMLRTCELDRANGEKRVFIPGRCARCDRASMTPGDLMELLR